MNFKPVIFLAFANDKVDNTAYLRNLSVEERSIRKALNEAVSGGLCEVVERTSATVSDIVDVFSDSIYGSRISIFHYGGHANGFSLLLESEDGSKAETHKDGLVPFLARQENLKLVFLNGCSSEDQATDLLKAGIPAVIGTTSSIKDDIATALAARFYASLGEGSGIEKAWTDATDEVKIKEGTGDTRALLWEGKKEATDRFPWVMQFRPGADIIKQWNLPDISGNPLYGLPPIPVANYNLPESPFLYLNRYERRHAEVFFGRSYYIRSLVAAVGDTQSPPVLLLYGQSGVGKSSLLEAGLQPRLESSHEIIYLRRNGTIGLTETIYQALLHKCGFVLNHESSNTLPPAQDKVMDSLKSLAEHIDDQLKSEVQSLIDKINASKQVTPPQQVEVPAIEPPKSVKEAWRYVEDKFKKPLLVILDQVEEAYTRPNDHLLHEVNTLFKTLKDLFGNPSAVPRGKIILSFRKEYHPEIMEYCKDYELPRSAFFIEHITRKDILEIFKGFTETPRLVARYHLEVEEGLPEVIANDLSADTDSPIAPMLQILLTKMWIKAISISPDKPVFTHKIYRDLKEEGLAMDEFLNSQLQIIKSKLPLHYNSGFLLEVLEFYCTTNNTAAAHSLEQLIKNYPGAGEDVRIVLDACKEHFLITDLGGVEQNAMLAHDTLAKSVAKYYQKSTKPLQQAQRVMASRMEAVHGGSEYSTLDYWDLALIDSVKKYMPALKDEEVTLIDVSRKEVAKKEKDKKVLSYIKKAIVAIILLSGIITGLALLQSRKHLNESILHAKESYINHLAASSAIKLSRDPTQALLFAAEGMQVQEENSIAEIKKSLTQAFYSAINNHMLWYDTIVSSSALNFTDMFFDDRSGRMIPYMETPSLNIYDVDGREQGMISVIQVEMKDAAGRDTLNALERIGWSLDGQTIIAVSKAGFINLYTANGALKHHLGTLNSYFSFDISGTSNEFITLNQHYSRIEIWDMNGNLVDSIPRLPFTHDVYFAPGGKNILLTTLGDTERVEWMDRRGKKLHSKDIKAESSLGMVTISPKGRFMAVEYDDNLIELWDDKGKVIRKIHLPYFPEVPNLNEIVWLEFHPEDAYLAVCYRNNMAYLYSLPRGDSVTLYHNQLVTFAGFSSDGQRILTGSKDNTAKIWNLKGDLLNVLIGHTNDVTGGKILEDNKVITTSLDGTVRAWKLDNYNEIILKGHTGPVHYLDIDPKEKYLVSVGAIDRKLILWDLSTKKEVDTVIIKNQSPRYVQFINDHEVLGITDGNEAFLYKLFDHSIIYLRGHKGQIEWAEPFFGQIVSASVDGTLRYWNKRGEVTKVISPYKSGPHGLLSLRASEKDSLVAVGGTNGDIFLYNISGDSVEVLKGHDAEVNYLDISHDGNYMVSASKDKTGIIWDLKSKKMITQLSHIACAPYNIDCNVISANFSNKGENVVTTSSDRVVRVWDLAGNMRAQMVGHTDALVDAFFAVQDKMIYSFSADRTLRLWEPGGVEVATYRGHLGTINSAVMSHDNKIYTASDDGTIHVWLTPMGVYNWMKESDQFKAKLDELKK